MEIQIKTGARINNPRNYEPYEVEQLRDLLVTGAPAQLDPRRENFYELEGKDETYYIHISPITGEIVLLARWNREPTDCCMNSGHFLC
jgi:hypothetical protein